MLYCPFVVLSDNKKYLTDTCWKRELTNILKNSNNRTKDDARLRPDLSLYQSVFLTGKHLYTFLQNLSNQTALPRSCVTNLLLIHKRGWA